MWFDSTATHQKENKSCFVNAIKKDKRKFGIRKCFLQWKKIETIGVCYGTKECDRCYCKGNELECDFYPEVRDKAKKQTMEYKIKAAIELLKENGYIVYKEV